MRIIAKTAALAALLAGCGGGGGGSPGNGNTQNAAYGLIQLLEHSPAEAAVQVAVGAAIVLQFDSAVALDSLGDEDTWLRKSGTTQNVAGSYTLGNGGRIVRFAPAAPLAIESDYEFQLSGLTCDDQGRLLDRTITFGFRTLDITPPQLQGVSVANNAMNQSRTGTFTLTFSEALDPASLTTATVYLRDEFGATYAGSRSTDGNTLVFDPFADLPGDRLLLLTVTDLITDRAGNALGTASTTSFTTASDSLSPSVMTMWPAQNGTGISPAVQPTYTFSESMDPGTVEPSSLAFQDQFGSLVPYSIHSSDDQRTLRVRPTLPLQPNRSYTLAFLLGAAAATDVSGNVLTATQALHWTTGTDDVPPAVIASTPLPGETRVSRNAILAITFAEALDSAWVDTNTVTLSANGQELAALVELPTPDTVRITPVLEMPVDTVCTVSLQGGHEGLHDVAGNVLAADHTFSFTTSSDSTLPRALLAPPDGAAGVPRGVHVSIVFDAAMDPATMSSATIEVMTDSYIPIAGTLEILAQNRVARFTPSAPLSPSTYYRTRVRGGSAGVRRVSGNWFSADQSSRFRTGTATDQTAPVVLTAVNGIDSSRSVDLVLPPHGFTIDVTVSDPGDQSIDMGSIEVALEGAGPSPGAPALYAPASVDYSTFRVTVPESAALAPGAWSLTVRATDLTGNLGASTAMSFTVAEATPALLPFERVQVVWVRSDLDRDGSGTADFEEDMIRLGLATAGDPIGANARIRNIVLDGVIAQANSLYGRGSRGEPIDSSSVWLRFTKRSPIAIAHMQIALGGFDPEGPGNRIYGAESTGVLGRAYYDYRNGNITERNTGTRPGLGVFPGEMYLYQTNIHQQVWPSYQTVFAQRFRPLAPAMGGVPAGSDPIDAVVLGANFNYATGTSTQRARWLLIMQAADDWATVMGVILAHEVGHSVGLVAPGPAPGGLFGDSSLHDTYAGAAEVMAPSVGYEAMLSLDYRFRDIDLAYLRQRILLR